MTPPSTAPASPPAPPRIHTDVYRAVWRWHFYAGLLVLPFLIWLAVTGGLFVFKDTIDDVFHRELRFASTSTQPLQPSSQLIAAALNAHPGSFVKYTGPATPGRTAEVGIATAQGRLLVYVDPKEGTVRGALPEGGSVAWTIRKLHSLKYFGSIARGAIEIAAGWAILLVLTGLYLWWPRGRTQGVVSVRGTPTQRVFWRDLHAVTGLFVGAALLFLAITGMPWSVFWGAKANELANGHNFGYPAGVRVQVPMSQARLSDHTTTAWSLQQAQIPQSGPAPADQDAHAGHAGHAAAMPASPAPTPADGALGWDAAIAIFDRLGIAQGYTVQPPKGPTGVYSASLYPHDLDQQRVIHIDQYSGLPLVDMRYQDYGPLGRWLEWGINVHLGQEFGVLNQVVLVMACLAIVLLCVSAGTMWWKRRPAKGWGVPPQPQDARSLWGVTALLAVGGVLFPLVGASFLVIALLDRWLCRPAQPAA